MQHLAFIQKMHSSLQEAEINGHNWEIRSLQAIGSTNSRVEDMLGLYEKVIILSQTQSQGRGRDQKAWYSPLGGLWLSLGFLADAEPVELSTPVIQVIHEIISQFIDVEIKEPNDLLVNGKKLCGILVESKTKGNRLTQVVIGVGINVANDLPDEVKEIATRLADHMDEPPNIHDLASTIVVKVIKRLGSLIPNL